MKREEDITTTTNTDLDNQSDAIYETDLTEPDDVLRKHLRSDENLTLESEISNGAREFYKDLLDEGGVDLSEIPEDFDKYILRISAYLMKRFYRRRRKSFILASNVSKYIYSTPSAQVEDYPKIEEA
ncbi:hypothetical protein N7512_006318 [Penicillium capsulatum]|nr:hypothetical protein N7512_006318 [Penicillium capsulatum]